MLNKDNRINSQELKKLKSGVSLSTPLFNVKKYTDSSSLNNNRIIIIISRKYLKKSTARNLLRRRVYAAYNKILKTETPLNPLLETSTLVLYYMFRSNEQEVPEYSIIEKQIKNICGIQ